VKIQPAHDNNQLKIFVITATNRKIQLEQIYWLIE